MTYTRFTETHDTGKTKAWSVDNSNNGSHIGVVKWHGAWRKYVLWPAEFTLWSADCLRDVADFIEAQMRLRREPQRMCLGGCGRVLWFDGYCDSCQDTLSMLP